MASKHRSPPCGKSPKLPPWAPKRSMQTNLFKYIWKHTRADQIGIGLIVLVAQASYFISLGIPKSIVNDAIRGQAFEHSRTAPFLQVSLPLPDFLGGTIEIFHGFDLARKPYLVALCLAFLFFVVVNGWLKQQSYTLSGRLGERMLRRLRYELFDLTLRFPLSHFRKVKAAEIATMIKDEVEPIGGFIGMAFSTPMLLGGQVLVALFFIFMQSGWLALGTVAVLGVQLAIIPRLRRKVLILGRQRQLTARQLAGRIAEVVDGATEIHTSGTANYERADIVDRLGKIFFIRFELYQRKYFVKYLNNMLAQVTPFLYYLVGGLLALSGLFDTGSLLAAINAYKDLPGPIKDMIDWDQQRQDVQIKYEQVIEQFSVDNVLAANIHTLEKTQPLVPATLTAQHLAYHYDNAKILDGVSFSVKPDQHVSIIGPAGSGKEALGSLLARLAPPDSGRIQLGDQDWLSLPEPQAAGYFSYVGDETFLFPGTIGENIAYGLKMHPLKDAEYSKDENEFAMRAREEAMRAGNPLLDPNAQWMDFALAGAENLEDLRQKTIALLETVEFSDDIYQFGLRGRIDPEAKPELAKAFLNARYAMRLELRDPEYAILVEPFDPTRYNRNMNIAENLLFGTAKDGAFAMEGLIDHPYLQKILQETGLDAVLFSIGRTIAETMVELFADLPPDHPFFEQFSFIAQEDLPIYELILGRVGKNKDMKNIREADRLRLIGLSFPYIEARHRLDIVDAATEQKIVQARRHFAQNLDESLKGTIEFYDPEKYNAAASVQDNILFGRLVYGQAKAAHKIGKMIARIIEEHNMRNKVIEVGFGYQVGIGGKRLTTYQRQKLALTRALLKRPQLMVLNLGLAIFEDATQIRLLKNLRRQMEGRALIAIVENPALARLFEHALVMRAGKIVEQGKLTDLDRDGTYLRELAGDTNLVAA